MAGQTYTHGGFKEAILACVDDLYRYAMSICHDATNAEDLVSETVLKALEKNGEIKDKTKLKQWMLRVLTNAFLDQRRMAKRIQHIPLDGQSEKATPFSLYEALSQSTFTDHNTPEIKVIQKMSSETIQNAIKQLPDTFRIAFVLCEVEDLSYQEIAHTLQIKVGTVRSRIARARSMLQSTLWEHAIEEGIKMKAKSNKKELKCDC